MNKIKKVMHEFKEGKLHSGSKHGPKVKNPKQAIAIAMSEQRKQKTSLSGKTNSKGHTSWKGQALKKRFRASQDQYDQRMANK